MTKVCSFCETTAISESESVCGKCRTKYGIGSYDNSKDGCGCGTWSMFLDIHIWKQRPLFTHKNTPANIPIQKK